CFLGSPMPNSSVMISRALLDRGFRFDTSFFPAADYHAWASQIVIAGVPTHIVPAQLVARRRHAGSITETKRALMAQQADAVRAVLFRAVGVDDERLIDLHNAALRKPPEALDPDL